MTLLTAKSEGLRSKTEGGFEFESRAGIFGNLRTKRGGDRSVNYFSFRAEIELNFKLESDTLCGSPPSRPSCITWDFV